MKPLRRAAVPLLLAFGLALVLAGCAGGKSEDEPDAKPTTPTNPAVGAYELTSHITRSTIEQNPVGPKSKATNTVYVSCWDKACHELAQRASTDMWHAQTFHLVPDGDTYKSVRTRVGPCGDGTDKKFQEVFDLSWTRADDGTLSGTAEQRFRGCEDDKVRVAVYELEAKPTPDTEIPYLDSDTAAKLAGDLTAYDDAFRKVSDGYQKCYGDKAADVAVVVCKADLYAPWIDDLDALAEQLPAYEDQAAGACLTSLKRPDFKALTKLLDSFVAAAGKVSDPTVARGAEKIDEKARKEGGTLHADLVQVATMCVPPPAYKSLGKDGVMLIDYYGSLIPPLDAGTRGLHRRSTAWHHVRMSRPPLHTTSSRGGVRSAAEYEFQRLTIPREFSKNVVTRMLVDRAERGGWELDRVRILHDGTRKVVLRRKIIRQPRPAYSLA